MSLNNLLGRLSYISAEDLAHAEQLASTTGLPLGKCFVILDCLTHDEFMQLLEARALMQDGIISLEQFLVAMEAVRRGWTLSDALTMHGLDAHSTRRTRLGELLFDAGAINESRLNTALRIGEFTSLPLGRVLTSFNAIDEIFIQLALKTQTSIRRGGLDRDAAVTRLQGVARPNSAVGHLKIGELLIRVGILSEAQMIEALGVAESSSKLVGEVMVESGKLSEEVLATALCVQELLDANLIDFGGANALINQVAQAIRTGPVEEPPGNTSMSFLTFLKAAGYLDSNKLAKLVIEGSLTKPVRPTAQLKIGRTSRPASAAVEENYSVAEMRLMLLKAFPEDRHLINSGLIIYELVRSGKLLVNQGLVVFGFRQHDLNLIGA